MTIRDDLLTVEMNVHIQSNAVECLYFLLLFGCLHLQVVERNRMPPLTKPFLKRDPRRAGLRSSCAYSTRSPALLVSLTHNRSNRRLQIGRIS